MATAFVFACLSSHQHFLSLSIVAFRALFQLTQFCWISLRTGYDGDVYFTVISNCFVHMVMYSYYELTTLGFKVPTPIKKMVTNLQMIQFIAMNTQAIWGLFFGPLYPVRLIYIYLAYIFSLLVLFQDFSSKEYKPKDKSEQGSKTASKSKKPKAE